MRGKRLTAEAAVEIMAALVMALAESASRVVMRADAAQVSAVVIV